MIKNLSIGMKRNGELNTSNSKKEIIFPSNSRKARCLK